MILRISSNYFPNGISQIMLVMDKFCVFSETETKLLNIIWISFVFKRLTHSDMAKNHHTNHTHCIKTCICDTKYHIDLLH
jgi:hypothetical protein